MKKILVLAVVIFSLLSANVFAISPTPADVGRIEGLETNEPYPWAENTKTAVSNAIIAEYEAQEAAGVNVGAPEATYGYAHEWGVPETVHYVAQNFVGGSSTGNVTAWGANYKNVAVIMVETATSQAFTVKDRFIVFFNACGAVAVAGCATSNEFVVDGYIYQRFSNFFMKMKVGKTVVEPFHFDQAQEVGLVIPKAALGATYKGGDYSYAAASSSATSSAASSTASSRTSSATSSSASVAASSDNTSSTDLSASALSGSLTSENSDVSIDGSSASGNLSDFASSTGSSEAGSSSGTTNTGSSLPAIIAVIAAVVLAGGVAAFVIIRRNRNIK